MSKVDNAETLETLSDYLLEENSNIDVLALYGEPERVHPLLLDFLVRNRDEPMVVFSYTERQRMQMYRECEGRRRRLRDSERTGSYVTFYSTYSVFESDLPDVRANALYDVSISTVVLVANWTETPEGSKHELCDLVRPRRPRFLVVVDEPTFRGKLEMFDSAHVDADLWGDTRLRVARLEV